MQDELALPTVLLHKILKKVGVSKVRFLKKGVTIQPVEYGEDLPHAQSRSEDRGKTKQYRDDCRTRVAPPWGD